MYLRSKLQRVRSWRRDEDLERYLVHLRKELKKISSVDFIFTNSYNLTDQGVNNGKGLGY